MVTFKSFIKEAVLPQQQTQQASQGGGRVTQSHNGTRNQPLSQALIATIQKGLAGTGLDWHSYSGGQPAAGTSKARVGSTRHDNGRASDGYFKDTATGRVLDAANAADRQRIAGALGKLRQAGIQGLGWGPGYMGTKNFHIDIVSPEIWGENGRSANAHQWVVAAAGGSVLPPSSSEYGTGQEGQTAATGGGQQPAASDYDSVGAAVGGLQSGVSKILGGINNPTSL